MVIPVHSFEVLPPLNFTEAYLVNTREIYTNIHLSYYFIFTLVCKVYNLMKLHRNI